MKITAIIEIIFVNLVTGELQERDVFLGSFNVEKSDFEKGSEILLPVGDRKSLTVFGKGAQAFSFVIENIKIYKGKPLLCLREEKLDSVFKEEFERNWKINRP